MPQWNAMDLARYTVQKCAESRQPISNLKLQKMLYFMQLSYCKASKGDLLFDEQFEAWQYGPVLPDVYREYSSNGASPIVSHKQPTSQPSADLEAVDVLIDALKQTDAWELVRKSHAQGSPWAQVWNHGHGKGEEIPNQLIRNYALE